MNPKNESLWQKPKRKVRGEDPVWYDNVPVGTHPLESFMRKLSESAGLSKMYTNHCIRATVITNLDNAGFEARHIRAVSGHKSDETIKSYAVRCPDSKKKEMSDALSSKLQKKEVKIVQNVPKPPRQEAHASTINFDDIVDFIPIENNPEAFDILSIIDEVASDKNDKKNQEIQPETAPPMNSENAVTPVQMREILVQMPKENVTLAQNPTTTTSNTFQLNQANNFPLIPQMYFPNSNVTINYNITQK